MNQVKISDISSFVTSGSRDWASYYSDEGALFLRMTNLPKHGIKLLLDDNIYVQLPEKFKEGKRTSVKNGDILVSITAELGKIGFIENFSYTEAYVNQHVCLIRPIHKMLNAKFLAYYLSSQPQRKLLNRLNDSGAKSGLNLSTISKFPINLPSKKIQDFVVSVLEKWDTAIEKTEALTDAKERQFRWFCSSLIGAVSTDATSTLLSDIYEFKKGSDLSKADITEAGKYKCILYGQLYTTYGEVIKNVISRTDKGNGVNSVYGDLLIPASTTTSAIDLANVTALLEENVLLGGDINILRPKSKNVNSEFIAYYLSYYKKYDLARLAQGITIIHLYGKDIRSINVLLPEIDIQDRVAELLNNARQEINLLKKIVEEYRLQKRGLMQKLLLGKWHIKEKKKEVV